MPSSQADPTEVVKIPTNGRSTERFKEAVVHSPSWIKRTGFAVLFFVCP